MANHFKLGLCSIAAATAFSATAVAPTTANAWCFWVYCSPSKAKSRGGMGAGKANFEDLTINGPSSDDDGRLRWKVAVPKGAEIDYSCGAYGCQGLNAVEMTINATYADGSSKNIKTRLGRDDLREIAQTNPDSRPAKTAAVLLARMQAKDARVPDSLGPVLVRTLKAIPSDTPQERIRTNRLTHSAGGDRFVYAVGLGQGDIRKLSKREQREGDGGEPSSEGDTAY